MITLTSNAADKLGGIMDQKGLKDSHALRVFVQGAWHAVRHDLRRAATATNSTKCGLRASSSTRPAFLTSMAPASTMSTTSGGGWLPHRQPAGDQLVWLRQKLPAGQSHTGEERCRKAAATTNWSAEKRRASQQRQGLCAAFLIVPGHRHGQNAWHTARRRPVPARMTASRSHWRVTPEHTLLLLDEARQRCRRSRRSWSRCRRRRGSCACGATPPAIEKAAANGGNKGCRIVGTRDAAEQRRQGDRAWASRSRTSTCRLVDSWDANGREVYLRWRYGEVYSGTGLTGRRPPERCTFTGYFYELCGNDAETAPFSRY